MSTVCVPKMFLLCGENRAVLVLLSAATTAYNSLAVFQLVRCCIWGRLVQLQLCIAPGLMQQHALNVVLALAGMKARAFAECDMDNLVRMSDCRQSILNGTSLDAAGPEIRCRGTGQAWSISRRHILLHNNAAKAGYCLKC